MADNKKDEQPNEDRPKVVGDPVPAPVNIDQALAYGQGHKVHWERETDDG